ncbi:hypothetical protein SEA_SIXAMA_188 [Gordonia phage Sixama]|uniref:Uncharacterized protein n=1 Tax=Gordonia phage Sixama TaxID=2653271 RepID=A0A5Q2F232_9CAUD|nr:hypothetical protein PP302_gp141 [Gordonia phage Sixama]QGF20338.1 hypothetical protein SEA_SIXAMA_188 [Gordonia phage Sixama]
MNLFKRKHAPRAYPQSTPPARRPPRGGAGQSDGRDVVEIAVVNCENGLFDTHIRLRLTKTERSALHKLITHEINEHRDCECLPEVRMRWIF